MKAVLVKHVERLSVSLWPVGTEVNVVKGRGNTYMIYPTKGIHIGSQMSESDVSEVIGEKAMFAYKLKYGG